MSLIKVTVSEDWRARFDQAGAALDKALSAGIGRVAEEGAREAKRRAPKAASTLTNSIRAARRSSLEYEVSAGADYAPMVERGTGLWGPAGRPSNKIPPLQSLTDWIRVRRITPDDPDMDVEELALLIGRSIAARGTPKQPFMAPAYADMQRRGRRIVERSLRRGLREAGLR